MLVIDTEVYRDYFLLSAKSLETGKVRHFEMFDGQELDKRAVAAMMRSYTTISFNGLSFDLPIICAALSGFNCEGLKKLANQIIQSKTPSWRICREMNLNIPAVWDHIDLIEVAPGQASLKIYGGRLNAPKMQDLPIDEAESIAPEMRETLRDYCVNDLETTELLYGKLKPAIELRAEMSKQYGMDLRSKSDAQTAETIIKSELKKITGEDYRPPKLVGNYGFFYCDPKVIEFQTPALQAVYERIRKERFGLGPNGAVLMPEWLRKEKIAIGEGRYQMGIGGLHSCESAQCVIAGDDEVLSDWDVASYYPNIILQQRLAPKSLGEPFLRVYQSIVERRLEAKKQKDTVTADTLKIAVNGSFGKLGSKYSSLYAPDLLIQTTVTGQLALLMLIERMHLIGVKVVSANTDGIVVLHKRDQQPDVDALTWEWMLDTSYQLERTDYKAIASRDVNNYVAVKLDGSTKGKGCFASGGLMKNPDQPIIYTAVAKRIADGTPVARTITECKDITQFVTIRRVQGGAIWRDKLLGKAVRFYMSTAVPETECIHYATNSNRVPKSAGAIPLMDLPDTFPGDVDYAYYLTAAEKLLCEVGYA